MPFTAQELSNIQNSTLDFYLSKGESFKQNIQNKPLLRAMEENSKTFPGGKEFISLSVKDGRGGGSLAGYSQDDQVGYYNPATNKRVNYRWLEHHIGIGVTHTELKVDGVTVTESAGRQSTSNKSDREFQALNDLLTAKYDEMAEDYNFSWNRLLWGDGISDAKSIAGVRAFILDIPNTGSTGGLSRTANNWWQNRAATAAFGGAGGQNRITSTPDNGGALLQFLQAEFRQLNRYAQKGTRFKCFAGQDFIGAMERELRANGLYKMDGFSAGQDVSIGSIITPMGVFEYDPTLDDLSRSKFAYVIDMAGLELRYMESENKKKTTPVRPYDRYIMYSALTTTAGVIAKRLNTSAVYEIA